ncbi:hypothetical protein C0J52_11630 [Blattella germanica]|nr:hypothetical protein C0J52_11630 [Blattella germanica]
MYHRQCPTRRSRPRVSDERVEEVRDALVRSPSKTIRVASRQLNMPISTEHKVLRKRLHLYAYKLELLHHIKSDDPARRESIDILDSIEAHPNICHVSVSVMNQLFMFLEKLINITAEYGTQRILVSPSKWNEIAKTLMSGVA